MLGEVAVSVVSSPAQLATEITRITTDPSRTTPLQNKVVVFATTYMIYIQLTNYLRFKQL